jgi:hypothetical protein
MRIVDAINAKRMTYPEAIAHLNNNHVYPKIRKKILKKEEVTTGLEVYCSPIMREMKEAHLRKVLNEQQFKFDWFPNEEFFLITIKS